MFDDVPNGEYTTGTGAFTFQIFVEKHTISNRENVLKCLFLKRLNIFYCESAYYNQKVLLEAKYCQILSIPNIIKHRLHVWLGGHWTHSQV